MTHDTDTIKIAAVWDYIDKELTTLLAKNYLTTAQKGRVSCLLDLWDVLTTLSRKGEDNAS